MANKMESYLESFNILTKSEIEEFQHLIYRRTIKKNDFFITEGKICKEVVFVESGLFRSFYYSSTGEEVTYCFTFAKNFLTAYSSLITQTPTLENIQALTDAELYSISKEQLLELEQSSTNWLRLMKLLAENEYVKMESRIFILQKEPAEKRYKDLLDNHPEYLQHVPLQYLASYLGITQRHLSRIRKSITN